jgi:hypothetical protein
VIPDGVLLLFLAVAWVWTVLGLARSVGGRCDHGAARDLVTGEPVLSAVYLVLDGLDREWRCSSCSAKWAASPNDPDARRVLDTYDMEGSGSQHTEDNRQTRPTRRKAV